MILIRLLCFALLFSFTLFSPVAGAADINGADDRSDHAVRSHLKSFLVRLDRIDASVSPGRAEINGQLQRFYKVMAYRNAWTNRLAIVRLVQVVEETASDGLMPEDYHFEEIRTFAENPPESPELRARADLLMTDAVFTILAHMRSGKVSPRSLDDNWNIPVSRQPSNVDSQLMDAVMGSKFPEMIAALRPSSARYAQLSEELARYRQLAGKGGWVKVPSGQTIEKIGQTDSRIPLIRQRLLVTGDFLPDALAPVKSSSSADSTSAALAVTDSTGSSLSTQEPMAERQPETRYTKELFEAVKAFQARHGLSVDGVIGNATVAAMNAPVETRIAQIRLNLEQLRWYLRDIGATYIMVNIPAFTVDYVRSNEFRWHSRVIVGKPDLQTPVFRAEMQSIILNPKWVIPSGILAKEALPAIMKNVGYLGKNQLSVVGQDGKPLDPNTINWAQYQTSGFPYRLVQASGDRGSLGRIKFLMPNRFTVYMHDTPSKQLFERSQRAFSHGCVRVDRPLELAEILFQDPDTWSLKKIQAAVAAGKTRTISLSQKVPVYFTYQTAFVEGERVQFRADIYNREKALREALDSRKESRIVEDAAR